MCREPRRAVARSCCTVRNGEKLTAVSVGSCYPVPRGGEHKGADELLVGSSVSKIANTINLKMKDTGFDYQLRYVNIKT
jgi:hypothetical protein